MKKYELTWKDFSKEEEEGNKKRTLIEITGVIFFLYFVSSLVSFWQYLNGEVPYSAFWHAPWELLIGLFF